MAGSLSIELARAEVDVGGSVAVDPGLRLDAAGTSVAGVKGDRLEDGEHSVEVGEKRPETTGKAEIPQHHSNISNHIRHEDCELFAYSLTMITALKKQ